MISSSGRAAAMSRPRAPYNRRAGNAGVGLIEVLVAVLILAVGMLGVAALQATALRNSQSSLERSQAVISSYAILDAMRANQSVVRTGAYDMDMQCDALAGGNLSQNDRSAWITNLQTTLGEDACGEIECEAVVNSEMRDCTITVQWNDARGTDGEAQQQVTTRTRI